MSLPIGQTLPATDIGVTFYEDDMLPFRLRSLNVIYLVLFLLSEKKLILPSSQMELTLSLSYYTYSRLSMIINTLRFLEKACDRRKVRKNLLVICSFQHKYVIHLDPMSPFLLPVWMCVLSAGLFKLYDVLFACVSCQHVCIYCLCVLLACVFWLHGVLSSRVSCQHVCYNCTYTLCILLTCVLLVHDVLPSCIFWWHDVLPACMFWLDAVLHVGPASMSVLNACCLTSTCVTCVLTSWYPRCLCVLSPRMFWPHCVLSACVFWHHGQHAFWLHDILSGYLFWLHGVLSPRVSWHDVCSGCWCPASMCALTARFLAWRCILLPCVF
jgi:hypothetical protein